MKIFFVKEFCEIISEPRIFNGSGLTVQHAELPEVDDELSVSLRIKLKSHYSSWAAVFRKGGKESPGNLVRTPGLFLYANNSKLHPRFTGNWKDNVGLGEVGDGLLLNKWYHITYTLSDSEKRMDIYINGVWTAFYAIENVQMHKIKFNDKPLDIGWSIDGEIGNFRYFNWRLSAEEAMKNYL
ncbi:concanavalin A-like lectin/glucanase domain-containing protein, partial [Rhizophagus diaphanus]